MRRVLRVPLTFFVLLLMLVVTNLSVCLANPSPYRSLPILPDKNEPRIIIREPVNSITLNDSKVQYSVTVVKPNSWFSDASIHGSIVYVWYSVDNTQEVEIANEQDDNSQQPLNYIGDISNLSQGNHSFQIHVWSVSSYNSHYDEANPQTWDLVEFYRIDTYSQKINFSIVPRTEQTSTPTPTVPEFSWLAIVPLLLSVFSIAIILRHRRPNQAI